MTDLWYSIAKDDPPLPKGLPFRFFVTDLGNGLGTNNLIGNYATPTDFYYQATSRYDVYSLIITISDSANFAQTDYGGIAGGLTNGIRFYRRNSLGVEVPLFTPDPIKQNYDWFSLTEHVSLTTFAGPAQSLVLDFAVLDSFGIPFTLYTGDRFIVRLNDNFTGLTRHTFYLRGTKF